MIARSGNMEIQLYANNVKLYPKFQEYFRTSKPPLLAIGGKHDPFFIPAGARAYCKDNPNAEVRFLDNGRFAKETHVVEIAAAMKKSLPTPSNNRAPSKTSAIPSEVRGRNPCSIPAHKTHPLSRAVCSIPAHHLPLVIVKAM
jgi:hypothetical protein